MFSQPFATAQAATLHIERPLPGADSQAQPAKGTDPLNMMFIVGLALVITVLARRFSGKGRRK